MSMQDTLADMFTRIRNGQMAGKTAVSMPSSKQKVALARVLADEGFLGGFKVDEAGIKSTVIELTDARKSVIQELIEDELSPYSQRLYRWRLKYQYKYFIRGGTSNDVPILKA